MNSEHLTPVMDAIKNDGMAFLLLPRGAGATQIPKPVKRRPRLFIIGDDFLTAEGPKGFSAKSLKGVLRGVKRIIIHAAKTTPKEYGMAVEATLAGMPAVIIETQPSHETEWLAYVTKKAPRAKVLMVTPNTANYAHQPGNA